MVAIAYLVKHVVSQPGCSFTDNQAVFLDKAVAKAYLHQCRCSDPDSDDEPESDGYIDTSWWLEELPLEPKILPERVQYRWKVPM